MELTKKLQRFNGRLAKGKIDWRFLFNNRDIQEANTAADMLIKSGFVKLHSIELHPPLNSDYWGVFDTSNELVNPCFKGERMYFARPKVAREYANYLHSLDLRRVYEIGEM